ncbi:Sec-independent protein translocase protein TatB [Pseudohongiella spirulinae]|uniref:Sec-independent protein translocase protein TatB n=1 Tax=Pseudohongiella spirulinae TaxID=1249552 RepID=A0A0S2KA21_9GAMM|nr:Sec-independent protein translocase protein TatB [Pseudohongiella spirulinae]
MFDIGFMELLLIGIVALLVLGPDKLPGAIRTGALWIGRARRSFNKVKSEIEQQINADDIRRQLHNESIMADIEKAKKNANKLLDETRKSVEDIPAVTSSAEEGVPTEPPSKPVETAKPGDPAKPLEQAEQTATTSNTHTGSSDTKPPTESDETTSLSGQSADSASPADTPEKTAPEKEPVYDFYNSPPTGRVSMQDGKFIPVDDQEDGEKK